MKENYNHLAIILAAGKGSRLSTQVPKPLYKIDGLPIIDHLINSISSVPDVDILTVVGHQKDKVISHIQDRSAYIVQNNQNGTADAVLRCIDYIKKYNNTFVFVGDTPFISSKDLEGMLLSHISSKADCSFLYSEFPFELPYGRLVFNKDNSLIKLIEAAHLVGEEKDIRTLFTSQYLFNSKLLLKNIKKIGVDNKTGEYNLTDIINIYIEKKYKISPILVNQFWRLMGINTLNDIELLKSYNRNEKK